MSFYEPVTIDQHVEEMRRFGEFLMQYNYPKVTKAFEDDVGVLKARETVIDGYDVIIHYNKSDYTDCYLETVQVLGRYMPFLPFSLVCKIGKRFLGDHHLSLLEIFQDNRKVYSWNVALDREGKVIPYLFDKEAEECLFEGFSYKYMHVNNVNLY